MHRFPTRRCPLLAMVALCACSSWGCSSWIVDGDLDGVERSDDCDDGNADIHPGADEVCDELDNDCDGLVDDDDDDLVDARPWYLDADGDGFGDPDSPTQACRCPSGYVVNALDCDDADSDSWPGAEEVCDGRDNDCDDVPDDGLEQTWQAFYADADGDGYGDPDDEVWACEAPSGYVALPDDGATDCDDTAYSINPAADEVCNEVDDDCDGLVDEEDDDLEDAPTWYRDLDDDGYGDADDSTTACTIPSGYTGDSTDCDDEDENVNPAVDEVCDGVDNDCDGLVDDGDDDVTGTSTWYADADGDGYGVDTDTVEACEAPSGYVAPDDDGTTDCDDGDSSIHPGAFEWADDGRDNDCDGTNDDLPLTSGDRILLGPNDLDGAGTGVAGAGDLDGDGLEDLLVGGADATWGGNAPGVAWLVHGSTLASLTSAEMSLDSADARLYGSTEGDAAGWSVAGPGDLDGDGTPDLLVGAPQAGSGGAVYLVRGPVTGDLALESADGVVSGSDSADAAYEAGHAVAGTGDFDGDGLPDVLVGSPGYTTGGSSTGAAWLFSGAVTGSLSLESDALAFLQGEEKNSETGSAVASLGDLDGDGTADLLVGAPGATTGTGGNDYGMAYVILGPVTGTLALADADLCLSGTSNNDAAGTAVAGPGDLNGDGYDDIAVGSPGYTPAPGLNKAGAAWVLFGPASNLSSLSGTAALDSVDDGCVEGTESSMALGGALAGTGDLDGDGSGDLLVGAENAGTGDEGAVFLIQGPASGVSAVEDPLARVSGISGGDFADPAVAAPGDVDGDGASDLLVGFSGYDATGTDRGAAVLVHGP